MTKRRVSGKQRLELVAEILARFANREIDEDGLMDHMHTALYGQLEPKHKDKDATEEDPPF